MQQTDEISKVKHNILFIAPPYQDHDDALLKKTHYKDHGLHNQLSVSFVPIIRKEQPVKMKFYLIVVVLAIFVVLFSTTNAELAGVYNYLSVRLRFKNL